MNNLRQISKNIGGSNAYQKLQWINKGALTLLPDNCLSIFDNAIEEIKRQSENDIAFLKESKKKYLSIISKQSKKKAV
jgi:hypothetical protein